jgi:hypothetical protein
LSPPLDYIAETIHTEVYQARHAGPTGDCKLWVYKKAVTLVQFLVIYTFKPLKRKLHLRATSKESIFQLQYISMYKEHFFLLAKL